MKVLVAILFVFLLTTCKSQGADNRQTARHPKGYVAHRAAQPLRIDGLLNEASWESAPWTDTFVDIEGDMRPLPRFRTRVKMLWDDTYFYIGAELEEPHVWATLTKRDTVIFHDNDFELFIDPNGDNHEYYEFEMNALNTVWDLFLPKPYKDGGRAVESWSIDGLKTAVDVRGTLNDPADIDSGWNVEIAIPWNALKEYAHCATPPQEDDQWRVNFSRVEWLHEVVARSYRKVKGTSEENWVWSPQWVVSMHRPETWGYVQFSSRESGQEAFRIDRAWEVKSILHTLYHAQRLFRDSTRHWAVTLDQLNLKTPPVSAHGDTLSLRSTSDGFVATMPLKLPGGATEFWHIRHDARLWRTDRRN